MTSQNQDLVAFIGHRIVSKQTQKLKTDPVIAIIELLANAWDAGATEVEITWPSEGNLFCISDNGHGMNRDEFISRWLEAGYNRRANQGSEVIVYGKSNTETKRKVYGKNGLGKFASLCFCSKYNIETTKGGECFSCDIEENLATSLYDCVREDTKKTSGHSGTKITALEGKNISKLPEKGIIQEISHRFVFDPTFSVFLNGVKVNKVEEHYTQKRTIRIDDKNSIDLLIFSRAKTEKDLKFSGICWHVKDRLVGDYSWKFLHDQSLLDGRGKEARRHAIVIKADCLNDAVSPDWSSFDETDPLYKDIVDKIQKPINSILLDILRESHDQKRKEIKQKTKSQVDKLPRISKSKINTFIDKTIDQCPSLRTVDLENITRVLATLEETSGQYGILQSLSQLSVDEWDKLDSILSDWTVEMAKQVLDEIQERIALIEELRKRTADQDTLEVQELQPLMEQCLWIFGPEFESIHFTSNNTITQCIKKLSGAEVSGSKNRPDFLVLPQDQGCCGFRCVHGYDEDYHESRIDKLIIVELKAPRAPLGIEEETQPQKYYEELLDLGFIDEGTKVTAFVLGVSTKRRYKMSKVTKGNLTIHPMLYEHALRRAESRLFNLNKIVGNAPYFTKDNETDLLLLN